MTDPLPPSESRPEADVPPGMPRWVKVTAVVVGLLILLFLLLQLTGIAGEHGPGMHTSTGQSSTLVGTTG